MELDKLANERCARIQAEHDVNFSTEHNANRLSSRSGGKCVDFIRRNLYYKFSLRTRV